MAQMLPSLAAWPAADREPLIRISRFAMATVATIAW